MNNLVQRPIDFDALEQEMHTELIQNRYAPRVTHTESATQIIAQGIVNLTWKEAEDMGNAIQARLKEGTTLTCAIQAWAAEWESFK